MKTIDGGPAPIDQFANALADGFRNSPIETEITGEGKLDRVFLISEAQKVVSRIGFEFEVVAHPWNNKVLCARHHRGEPPRVFRRARYVRTAMPTGAA